MYTPRHFEDTADHAVQTIRDHPFAVLLTGSADGLPAVSHLPMIFDPDDPSMLIGHVARANPHARALATEVAALAVFSGPDGYVSPNWYPSKRAGGQAVPTWNYVAAHVAGRIRPVPDHDGKRRIVHALSTRFEGDGPGAWSLDDEPEDFVRRQLGGIVAFALQVEDIQGKAKLSQNRPAEDREGVLEALAGKDDPASAALASAMSARGIGGEG